MQASHSYSIYFPSVSPAQVSQRTFQAIKDASIDVLSESFGGLSISEKSGYWKDLESGKIVKEDISIFELSDFSKNPTEGQDRYRKVKAVVRSILFDLCQDSVFVQIDGKDHLFFAETFAFRKDFPEWKDLQ